MNALDDLLDTLDTVYGEAGTLLDSATAHVVIDGSRVLSHHAIPGVALSARETDQGVVADLVVARGARIAVPIHTCIGLTALQAIQRIHLRVRLEPQASAEVLAHCLFPRAEVAQHVMDAQIELGEGAVLRYAEGHYHGWSGGVEVRPHSTVRIGPQGRFFSDFSITTGRVGRLALTQRVEVAEGAVAEITARIHGRETDRIRLEDELVLAGREARGLIKTRIALQDEARAEVIGIARGQAEGARGHMDCLEIVRDRAVARAEPIVEVSHPLAKVTHEAAVGTVDQRQLETLMARGLTPDEAVEVIVTGMLG